MPELPEVEVVCRALAAKLLGQRLLQVRHSSAPLRYPLPDCSSLVSHRLLAVRRRAKYVLLDFDHGQTLLWHLGMSGQFHVLSGDEPAAKHEHVRMDFSEASLRYRDPRRFGYLGLSCSDSLMQHPWLRQLGAEPLADDFPLSSWVQAMRLRKAAIKLCLMDNHLMVGVGNIYASESLFRAGIHPQRPAAKTSAARIRRLHSVVCDVLREAIAAGGSTIQSFSRPDGRPGYFAHSFAVYGRAGEACQRCQHSIRQCTQSGRSTFYCAHCQR